MADLDFSSGGTPLSGAKAPDFASQGTPVTDVGSGEAAGRGFVSGGGRLLQALGGLASGILPAPGTAPTDAQFKVPAAQQIGAPLSRAGNEAVQAEAIQPGERLDGLGAKVAFQGAELAPQLAAAIGTGGTASLEGLAPAAIRSVPILGRTISAVLAGVPTATALNAEQLASAPVSTSDADLAKSAALNYALAGVPGAIGSSPLVRTLSGGAIGAGLTAGQNALEGKPQDAAGTIVGALTGAALAGGHAGAEPLDPYLQRYVDSSASTGPARLELPAPTEAAAATEVQPAPTPSPAPAAPQPATPVQHAEAFHADPRAALDQLDHPTLMQLADDAGLDVGANEKRVSIISKLAGLPRQALQDDVLPGYLDAVASKPETQESVVPTPEPDSGNNIAPSPLAEALGAGQTVAVDNAGNAFTPAQGGGVLAEALQGRAQQLATPALPQPVTTVDAQGNAVDSGAFTRAINDQLAQQQAGQQAITDRANLGLTPDIERANAPRWAAQEAANRQSALDVADRQAMADYREAPELTGQRLEDMPGEFDDVQAEIDADRLARADYADQGELSSQRTEDMPPEPAWWEAGQRAQEAHDADLANMEQDRQAMTPEARERATAALDEAGIAPEDHEEALATTQLLERAYDAGATPHEVRQAISTDDSAEAVQNLRELTDHLENTRAVSTASNEAQSAGAQAPDQGRAGAGAGATGEASGQKPAGTGSTDLSRNGRELGDGARVGEEGLEDYRGSHRAPNRDGGAPLSDLAKVYPDDVYGPKASQYYGHHGGNHPQDVATVRMFRAYRGEPDAPVTIYRAVPRDAGETINPGDWVTINRSYAEDHGESQFGDDAKILSKQVRAGDIYTNGDSIHEFGYDPASKVSESVLDSSKPGQLDQYMPPSERRADWSAPVEGRAITALDDLVKRYGGSTLADSIRDDLRETTTAQLVGQTVKSPEDLAALASIYRNPAFETMRYVYTNKDGVVLGETAVSSRMPSSAVAFPTDHNGYDAGIQWMGDTMPKGTHGVWMIHNHPSGNPKPSQADLDYTGSMSIKLGDKGGAPRLLGHVVLDHGTFGHIDSLGDFKGIKPVPGVDARTGDPLRRAKGDTDMFSVPVTSPAFAATTGKRIAAATPSDSSAVVIMDAKGQVASVHTFPNDFLTTPRGAAMLSRIGGKRGAVGIGIVTTRDNFIQHKDAFAAAARRGLLRDATVVADDGRVLSAGGTPVFPNEVRKNYGQQSAGARRRNEAGVQVYEEAPSSNMSLTEVRKALLARGESPEKVAAMSPAELRTEKAGLRARSAPTPEQRSALETPSAEGHVTGIKNATKAEERAMAGKAEVEHDLSRTDAEAWQTAKDTLSRDPHAGTALAAALVKKPRTVSKEETFVLTQDAMRIKKDRRDAFEVAAKAQEKGDTDTQAAARERIAMLDAQMEANDQAAKMTGYELGAGLAARRRMAAEDYSMSSLVTQGKVCAGRDLKPDERAKLESLSLEIEKRQKQLDDLDNQLRQKRKSPQPRDKQQAARERFADLTEQLKKIASKDQLKEGCIV